MRSLSSLIRFFIDLELSLYMSISSPSVWIRFLSMSFSKSLYHSPLARDEIPLPGTLRLHPDGVNLIGLPGVSASFLGKL